MEQNLQGVWYDRVESLVGTRDGCIIQRGTGSEDFGMDANLTRDGLLFWWGLVDVWRSVPFRIPFVSSAHCVC